jgi:hypothetical protein
MFRRNLPIHLQSVTCKLNFLHNTQCTVIEFNVNINFSCRNGNVEEGRTQPSPYKLSFAKKSLINI